MSPLKTRTASATMVASSRIGPTVVDATASESCPAADCGITSVSIVSPQWLNSSIVSTREDIVTMNAQRIRIRCLLTVVSAVIGLSFEYAVRAQEKTATPTLGTIERIDPRFNQLVPQDAACRAAG